MWHGRRPARARRAFAIIAAFAAFASCAALSVYGCGADYSVANGSTDAQAADVASVDAVVDDAARDDASDAATSFGHDATPIDATDAAPCDDAGFSGVEPLTKFVLRGGAGYNLNADGIITLTNSIPSQAGAAWLPAGLTAPSSYTAVAQLRVGPNQVYGDGIAFAALESNAPPSVGTNGVGSMGIKGIGLTGYAVVVDMFNDGTDPTDDAVTTLKIVTMPDYVVLAHSGLAEQLNDGNVHALTVQQLGSTIIAQLQGPTTSVMVVTTNATLQLAGSVFFGCAASTSGPATSHNELAALTFDRVCR